MGANVGEDLRTVYGQLARLVEKEERALAFENLIELEACMRRRAEIVKKLQSLESKRWFDESSDCVERVAGLLEQIIARQERVKLGIKLMASQCQDAIMEIRAGQQAHRAYHRAAKKPAATPQKRCCKMRDL
jgi:hypothetical protein